MSSIDLLLSIDGGVSFAPVMTGMMNMPGQPVGLVEWTVPDVSTTQARLKLVARDLIGNVTSAITGNHTILGSAGDTSAPTVEVVQPNKNQGSWTNPPTSDAVNATVLSKISWSTPSR